MQDVQPRRFRAFISRSFVEDTHELQQEPAEDQKHCTARQTDVEPLSAFELGRIGEHEDERGADDIERQSDKLQHRRFPFQSLHASLRDGGARSSSLGQYDSFMLHPTKIPAARPRSTLVHHATFKRVQGQVARPSRHLLACIPHQAVVLLIRT
jgi:hypothetical protein